MRLKNDIYGVLLMNDTVITKQIDDLGRIVLPKEIRKRVGIQIRSDVEVRVEGEKIVLTKAQNECIFCGLHKDLKEFKGKCICPSCLKGIEELENK